MSNRTATPAQIGFIRSLLTARQELLELVDVDAFIAEQKYAELTVKAASDLITQIKGIKPEPVVNTTTGEITPSFRANGYPGKCQDCGKNVAAREGRLEGAPGRWVTRHLPGECPATVAAIVLNEEEGAAPVNTFELTDGVYDVNGVIVKVVWNQSHTRLYGKALTAREVGTFECDGTPRYAASWDYAPGLTASIKSNDQRLSDAEAAEFGTLYSFCCNCGIDLTDERSIVAGYGATCARNNGWSYPTKAEAAAKITPEQALRAAENKARRTGVAITTGSN